MADEEYFEGEALQVKLDRRGPILLDEVAASFAALSRLYSRHHAGPVESDSQRPAKLFITRVETGSLVAWVTPLIPMIGQAVQLMDTALIIRGFARFLGEHIRFFVGNTEATVSQLRPSRDDIRDLREFIKPVIAQADSNLRLRAARYKKSKPDGDETSIEFEFHGKDLSIAALRMDDDLKLVSPEVDETQEQHRIAKEKLMRFQQASRVIGKVKGHTGDLVIIQDVSPKPIKVYFPEGAADIKRRILEDTENPFAKGYIVDASIQYVGNEPKVYYIIRLHDVVDLD